MLISLRKNQSKCLDDEPAREKREDIELYRNPGSVYDVDLQCRYAIGQGQYAKACYEDDQDAVRYF